MASEYDARQVAIELDGNTVAKLDSFGYDQSKAHELQRTLDEDSVWVKGTGEFTGTVVMKANSDTVTDVDDLFHDDEVFDIVISYADDEPRTLSTFTDCMLTDWGPSDYELDNLPTVEGSWEADQVTHEA